MKMQKNLSRLVQNRFYLYERLQKDPARAKLRIRSKRYILSKTVLVLPGIAKINGF